MPSERVTLTAAMLYDAGREDGRRDAAAEIARLTRELEAARELLRQIAADRCRCLHPFDICGNCRARRALVANLSSGRYAARDDVADRIAAG